MSCFSLLMLVSHSVIVSRIDLILFCLILLYPIRLCFVFFFSSRRRHTRFDCDWSSDVCSSDLILAVETSPGRVRSRANLWRVYGGRRWSLAASLEASPKRVTRRHRWFESSPSLWSRKSSSWEHWSRDCRVMQFLSLRLTAWSCAQLWQPRLFNSETEIH